MPILYQNGVGCQICDSGAMERSTSDKDTRDKVERMPLPQERTTKWGIQI